MGIGAIFIGYIAGDFGFGFRARDHDERCEVSWGQATAAPSTTSRGYSTQVST